MLKTCPKCHHENHDATGADDEACPACGVIYKKAFEAMRAQREKQQRSIAKVQKMQAAAAAPRQRFVTPKIAKGVYYLLVALSGLNAATAFMSGPIVGFISVAAFVVIAVVGILIVEAIIVLFVIAEATQDSRDHLAVIRASVEAGDS